LGLEQPFTLKFWWEQFNCGA